MSSSFTSSEAVFIVEIKVFKNRNGAVVPTMNYAKSENGNWYMFNRGYWEPCDNPFDAEEFK